MHDPGISMADLKYVMLATAFLFAVEFLFGQLRTARWRDFGVTAFCYAINSTVTRPLSAALVAFLAAAAFPKGNNALSGLSLMVAYPVVFVAMEFAFYWVHRWSHEVQGKRNSWLWKIHRTHHSATHLNVSVTMRQNIFWAFVVPNTWVLGISIYLGLGQAAALSIITTYAWNLLTHTHFRWDDPLRRSAVFARALYWLEHVIVSPAMHHTHHGYGKDGKMYRNFAVTLSIFDTLFGTLYVPSGRPAHYGIPGGDPHWVEEVFFPLFRAKAPARAANVNG